MKLPGRFSVLVPTISQNYFLHNFLIFKDKNLWARKIRGEETFRNLSCSRVMEVFSHKVGDLFLCLPLLCNKNKFRE